jgi:carbamoyltransferase
MRILSIHFGHDASFCVYEDGKIHSYFLTERTTKVKYDDNIQSIINLFFDLNLQVEYLVISSFNISSSFLCVYFLQSFIKKYREKYNHYPKVIFKHEHHTTHAKLSFYNSGFDKSIVLVADGSGSPIDKDNLVEVESVYEFKDNSYTLLYKNVVSQVSANGLPWDIKFDKKYCKYDNKNIFSIGILYEIAAILTGNTGEDCGKAMGLSSYGSPNKLFKHLFLEKNTLNNDFFKNCSEEIKYFLKTPVNEITKENYKVYADFCYEVQLQTQTAIGDLIEDAIHKTGIQNVCISGGYGMNIVANYYYLQRFPNVKFYFEPMCNDSGCSIGSAISTYVDLTGNKHIPIRTTSFHGFNYDISRYKGKLTSTKDIAKLLYQNKSVAVYTGLSEAGQRALGNRSILFNALNPDAKELVNKIKKREWYRPFACMILEEDANIYFDMGRIKSSPFMTICFPVRPEYVKIIPGVTHVDDTCRIQTVSKTNGYLYELIQEFKKLSGHGVLLNTSFNLAGDPLVETPKDAFNTLNNSCLDYLWFEETQQLFDKSYV